MRNIDELRRRKNIEFNRKLVPLVEALVPHVEEDYKAAGNRYQRRISKKFLKKRRKP